MNALEAGAGLVEPAVARGCVSGPGSSRGRRRAQGSRSSPRSAAAPGFRARDLPATQRAHARTGGACGAVRRVWPGGLLVALARARDAVLVEADDQRAARAVKQLGGARLVAG